MGFYFMKNISCCDTGLMSISLAIEKIPLAKKPEVIMPASGHLNPRNHLWPAVYHKDYTFTDNSLMDILA